VHDSNCFVIAVNVLMAQCCFSIWKHW